MRLSFNISSPYVRRISILAAWFGIADKIEHVNTVPYTDAGFRERNPGGTVPSLETEDGEHIYDSLAIGYYFDQQFADGRIMDVFTSGDLARLKVYAEIEAMQIALVKLRQDVMRGENRPVDWYIERFQETALATAKSLNGKVNLLDRQDFIAASMIAVLGMVEFRFPHIAWREAAPDLAHWYDAHEADPMIATSYPQDIVVKV